MHLHRKLMNSGRRVIHGKRVSLGGRAIQERRVILGRSAARRRVILVSFVLFLVPLFAFTGGDQSVASAWSSWSFPLSGKVFVLDPGHGGVDGGAVSRDDLVEKEIALKIALYLRDYLQEAGAVVFMTRETDKDLASQGTKGFSRRKTEDLMAREKFINESGADFFFSIHLNAVPSPHWRGAQTFFVAEREESRRMGEKIQEELVLNLENTSRAAHSIEDVYLLEQAHMPAILVEVGFLSNPEEAALLGDERYQQRIAATIYRGILRYYTDEALHR